MIVGLLCLGANVYLVWYLYRKYHPEKRFSTVILFLLFSSVSALSFLELFLLAIGSLGHTYIPSDLENRMNDLGIILATGALFIGIFGSIATLVKKIRSMLKAQTNAQAPDH